MTPLPREYFDRPAIDVARDLLGAVLTRASAEGAVAVRLTEVEAYAGEDDPGSHAFRGPTARNATMFGPPGHAYVYFTYGMHFCMNAVCGAEGTAQAVLLRAGTVIDGVELARARRYPAPDPRRPAGPAARLRDLARGPARLTRALAVDRSLDGADLCDPAGPLQLRPGEPAAPQAVRCGPRVGVSGPGGLPPWRFWLAGEPSVSAYRPGTRRRRAASDA